VIDFNLGKVHDAYHALAGVYEGDATHAFVEVKAAIWRQFGVMM